MYEVQIAPDGPRAIGIALRQRPEFVLLDIGLPAMDGYEVAVRLRQAASCTDAVIIAISGYGTVKDREEYKLAGFAESLVKPVDVGELMGAIGRVTQAATDHDQTTYRNPNRNGDSLSRSA